MLYSFRSLINSLPVLLILANLGLCGCSKDMEVPPQTKEAAAEESKGAGSSAEPSSISKRHDGGPAGATIGWYQGQLEDAFALAKKEGKPLFLYWGAVWCPPCEEIKQTVFKSPEFIALSKLFVPVYLDGDTQQAQTWGEHFAVQGYPTMIVFSAAGDEVTRIPGGIDISQYNTVLSRSLESLRSTADIYSQALSDPRSLVPEDYNQLAFYSWWQSNLPDQLKVAPDSLMALANSARAAGNQPAAMRLQLQSLVMLYNNEQELSLSQAEALSADLQILLADKSLVQANLDLLMFWSEELLGLLVEPGPARNELMMRWVAGMKSVRNLPSLSHAEQLGTWYPQLHFYWLDNPEAQQFWPNDTAELLAHIERLDERTRGSARQTFVNRAYQVLLAARMPERARTMLSAEIKRSREPYYFMSSLAALERKEGNAEAAVSWLAKAYGAAHGNATRFQWGVEYLQGLLAMQPEQLAEIETALGGLLANLRSSEQVFSGRNYRRLNSLLPALEEWPKAAVSATVMDFYGALYRACLATPDNSSARSNCQSQPQLVAFLQRQGVSF